MNSDYINIVDKLLDMNPDPIPKLVLMNFKGYAHNSAEYKNAYDRACEHPFVKKIVESQNANFWSPFHGDTEGAIRKLLWYGLDAGHPCLRKVTAYTERLLLGDEPYDRFEKQDNIRWWPEMFMPLCVSATLSMLDNGNAHLAPHRERWKYFTELAFLNGDDSAGTGEAYANTQREYFGFKTKHILHPFNLYCLLLLAPYDGQKHLSATADRALVDYGMNAVNGLYYVYSKRPGDFTSIDEQNKDSYRDFCHWIRTLTFIAQFDGWARYEQKYVDWIMGQRNQDGLWAFPRKHYWFGLSDSWRGNNRAIDSTISVLRLLMKQRAY